MLGSQYKIGQKDLINPCLVTPNLIKFTELVNHVSIGEHLTDHRALEICIDWAKATRGKGNFQAKLGIEKKY